ncbi:hypothetical protein [Pseudoalteromonas sp.]|uniref:hypothetical protein n=1 Tax=Pseudoalteromonas sp. TaxID=53249 RepID=UPI002601B89F|nr:hypothetical protein [Pseudoalteromonas sp.]MCP4585324.1 hypothetical protein [Pseudoalteromonas sp.]
MFQKLASVPSQRQPDQMIEIGRVPHGLNTYEPADRIAPTEASKLLNWMITKGGKKIPRLPIALYSNSATTNAIKYIKGVNIGGTDYELVIDSGYRLYYLDGSLDPTLIGTLEGDATVLNYNGIVMLFDGSYIKYIEDVATIKIAYDAGSGSSGYQFDKTAEENTTLLALGNGTNLAVAQKFTTQAWTATYTIPAITVSAYLSENGTAPSGAITCKIRATDDSSTVLATQTFLTNATDLNGVSTATEYSMTFSSVDTELSPSTAYFCSLEYSAGDAGNYVKVHCNTVASGGLSYYGDTDLDVIGNWNADATKDCLMSLTPGRPPKGKYGVNWNNRPWVWGDPDNLGVMHYGNLTHLDWSSTNGGGSLGIVDDSGDAYEVGGAEPFWNDLYVFGTQEQPYMVKISGSEPNSYTQNVVFKEPWTVPLGIVNSVNELWFINADGVSPISGVSEYGDLRTRTASDPVYDRIKDNWDSSTAFAGYYPKDGQLWLFMPSYNRILICHTKLGVVGPDGVTMRYPWSEYEFYRYDLSSSTYTWEQSSWLEWQPLLTDGGATFMTSQPDFFLREGVSLTEGTQGSMVDLEWDYTSSTVQLEDRTGSPGTTGVNVRTVFLPTCVEQSGSNFLMGSSDKYIYKLNTAATAYTDMGTIDIEPVWASSVIEMPGGHVEFNKFQPLMSCETAPTGPNLVTDGEITDADAADDWTPFTGYAGTATRVDSSSDPGTSSVDSGATDKYCLKVVSSGTNFGQVYQTITTVPGQTYIASALCYFPSANLGLRMARIAIYYTGGVEWLYVTSEDEWVELSITFTATTSTVDFHLGAMDLDEVSTVYFDNIKLYRDTAFSSVDVNFYVDRRYTTSDSTETISLPETSTEEQAPLFRYINFTAWAIMVETDNISMSSPIFDDGLRLWFRHLST